MLIAIGENQLQYSFVIRSPDYLHQNFHPIQITQLVIS
jgi:hypothetical protein